MKIIELLNKIANGEEVPKVIKSLNYKYIFDTLDKEYQRYQNGVCYGFGEDRRLDIILDEEIEIIEENKEEKKIPEKLKSLNNVGNSSDIGEFKDKQQLNNHLLKNKINEIIDYLDYLKSKGE